MDAQNKKLVFKKELENIRTTKEMKNTITEINALENY